MDKPGYTGICLLLTLLMLLPCSAQEGGFKAKQMEYPRVRAAYEEKEKSILELLSGKDIIISELEIFIRVFKEEQELELWGRNRNDSSFVLLKLFPVCATCGEPGPKRMEGDMQIPEGFYHIDAFNHWSSFHLSMRINYPNRSDRMLGVQGSFGGNICIHGACATIGCLPLTDDLIKELYIFCVESRNNGQEKIKVYCHPCRLTEQKLNDLTARYEGDNDRALLWEELFKAQKKFEQYHIPAKVAFLSGGRHATD